MDVSSETGIANWCNGWGNALKKSDPQWFIANMLEDKDAIHHVIHVITVDINLVNAKSIVDYCQEDDAKKFLKLNAKKLDPQTIVNIRMKLDI
jgi:phage terminase large subunit-like protein